MTTPKLFGLAVLATAIVGGSMLYAATRRDGPAAGEEVEVAIPPGAALPAIARRLDSLGLIGSARMFAVYARLKGAASQLKAGRYRLVAGTGYRSLLETLRAGTVVTIPLTIPEGLTLEEVAPRIADFTGDSARTVLALLEDSSWVEELDLPGPTL